MSVESFAALGYALVPAAIGPDDCNAAIRQIEQRRLTRAGSRNLLALHWCRELVAGLKANAAVSAFLPTRPVAVQCTLFEKTPDKNWGVAPHQDLSIPVRERVSSAACAVWTQKEGVHYTQPPPEVLADLVAVRVHLDPCPATAGPLRVVPGSHRDGRLTEHEIARWHATRDDIECVAHRGDALIMRPLILHASSRGTGNAPRRVLHFLFGPPGLPYGLRWHQAE